MSTLTPENNMVVLANAAELATVIFYNMIGEESARKYFGTATSRAVLADSVMAAVQRKISPAIRELPTGQFMAAVKRGESRSRMTQRSSVPTI